MSRERHLVIHAPQDLGGWVSIGRWPGSDSGLRRSLPHPPLAAAKSPLPLKSPLVAQGSPGGQRSALPAQVPPSLQARPGVGPAAGPACCGASGWWGPRSAAQDPQAGLRPGQPSPGPKHARLPLGPATARHRERGRRPALREELRPQDRPPAQETPLSRPAGARPRPPAGDPQPEPRRAPWGEAGREGAGGAESLPVDEEAWQPGAAWGQGAV